MNRQTHLILRWLAFVPVIAAVAVARAPPDDPDHGIAANVEPAFAADTVPVLTPVSDAAEIPALFTSGSLGAALVEDDDLQPELIGIAGRLPDDVEVLLRMPEGQTRSLRVGERVSDWLLVSAAADRAVFSDNGRQVVLTLGPLP